MAHGLGILPSQRSGFLKKTFASQPISVYMKGKAIPLVAMGLCVWLAQAAALRPSATEEFDAVERTRAVAVDYLKRMPDFICTQTIHRFFRLTLPKTWQPNDVISVKLRYSGQTEDRRLVQRNGQPADEAQNEFDGLVDIGEFGGMLETIFGRDSQAAFHWESWKTVRGRPAAVYSYQVEKAHSLYMLNFNPGYEHRLVVGYHGTVEIDRETGGVLRMVYEADGIPKDFPMQFASTAIDYDFVDIAGKRFLLPLRSEVETGSDVLRARNISEFADYRKFSADTAITFGDTVEKQ